MTENKDLPFAQGLTFDSLDAYLAHLERRSAMDTPWYRTVGPDLYELVPGGRGRRGIAERFSRAELMQRFGFDA